MPSYCPRCGAPLTSDIKFCEECGAPLTTGPLKETTPATEPVIETQKPSEPVKPPVSNPEHSIRPLYYVVALAIMVVIGGAIVVFSGMLDTNTADRPIPVVTTNPITTPNSVVNTDPVVGTWLYSKTPLTVWLKFSDDSKGEIVIVDASDGFYFYDSCTWEKDDSNKYELWTDSETNLLTFTLNEDHNELSSNTNSDAILIRTSSGKPSATSSSVTKTVPRFVPGDIVNDDPFGDLFPWVILSYSPSSDKYAMDVVYHKKPGYISPNELDYTHQNSRDYVDKNFVKLDHIDLKSIKIR